jgi:tripartite-type tricarboxylate transporter receptor subunit TctC
MDRPSHQNRPAAHPGSTGTTHAKPTARTARRAALASIASMLGAWPLAGLPQGAGGRPISLVVGYPAGGSVDLVARALAVPFARRLGQPVQVENIAGASGTIGAVKVALAEADGHTLLLGSPSEVGINHLTSQRDRFNPQTDLVPIGLIGSQPMVLVAGRSARARSVAEFLDFATRHPGEARYATAGPGTPLHLAGETIRQRAGIDIRHQPYRGAGPMLPDLLDGRVDFAVMVLSSALPHIREGRLHAIGLTSARRTAALPNVQALAEHPRLAGVDLGVWFGVLGPRRLPPVTQERLATELRAAMKEPALRLQLQGAGLELMEDVAFAPFLRAEIEKFRRVLAGAQVG